MPHPNLLFVFADQMRGMDMACAGNPEVRTPNLDRLAGEGMMFPRTYANSPVCTPSRAIMLSGRYPLSNRVPGNDLPLPPEIPSFGNLARAAGYRTGYVGKWHLDGVPRGRFTPPGPRRHGFDHWAVWNCSHDYFGAKIYRDSPEPMVIDGYEPVGHTDFALEFLRQSHDRPFCLFLSWGPPHNPYDQVPEKYRAMYDPEQITLRGNVRDFPGMDQGPRGSLANYYAHITALDEQLGRLLEAVDDLGQADDTIVVFTSDHGDMLFSQGSVRKQQPWEESIRIPFIIRWPGRVPRGEESSALLSVVDFAPTLLSLMGIAPDGGMEGMDLSGAMLGDSDQGPSSVFLMEMIALDEAHGLGLREWRGIRTPSHTYARWIDGEPWLLIDNYVDPLQMNNLAKDPAHAEVRARLEADLESWLRRTGDRCLPWDDLIRQLDLVDVWNARERELHGAEGRFLDK